jgi:hypothetical protein
MNISPGWIYRDMGSKSMNQYLENVLESTRVLRKPLFVVLARDDDAQIEFVRRYAVQWLDDSGVASFPDFRLAARVMRRMKAYGDYLP